jgi:integrase/recombinase XerD
LYPKDKMPTTIQTLTTPESELLIKALWEDTDESCPQWRQIRNVTMAMLMLDAGLRVGEVVQLIISDLWIIGKPASALCVRQEVAKCHKERTIPLTVRSQRMIELLFTFFWYKADEIYNYNAWQRPYSFLSLSTRQVERIIRDGSRACLGRSIHPHTLRHTFATRLMRVTDIRTVQTLLGHSSLTSTQIYTHPDANDLHDAIHDMESGKTS